MLEIKDVTKTIGVSKKTKIHHQHQNWTQCLNQGFLTDYHGHELGIHKEETGHRGISVQFPQNKQGKVSNQRCCLILFQNQLLGGVGSLLKANALCFD